MVIERRAYAGSGQGHLASKSHQIASFNIDDYVAHARAPDGSDSISVSQLELPANLMSRIKQGATSLFDNLSEQSMGPFASHNQPALIGAGGMMAAPQAPVLGQPMAVPMGTVPLAAPAIGTVVPNMQGFGGAGDQLQALAPAAPLVNTQVASASGAVPVAPSLAAVGAPGQVGAPASVPIANVVRGNNFAFAGAVPNEVIEKTVNEGPPRVAPGYSSRLGFENWVGMTVVALLVVFLVAGCIVRIRSKKKKTR